MDLEELKRTVGAAGSEASEPDLTVSRGRDLERQIRRIRGEAACGDYTGTQKRIIGLCCDTALAHVVHMTKQAARRDREHRRRGWGW